MNKVRKSIPGAHEVLSRDPSRDKILSAGAQGSPQLQILNKMGSYTSNKLFEAQNITDVLYQPMVGQGIS